MVQLPEDRKAEAAAVAAGRDQSPSLFTKAVNKGEQLLRGLSAVPATSPTPVKRERGSMTDAKPVLTKERSGSMSKEHPASIMKVEKQPSFGKAADQPGAHYTLLPNIWTLMICL